VVSCRAAAAGLLVAVCAAIGPARAETPEEIFGRGNHAFEEGRFDEAAEAYRSLLRYGISDPRVEYNLGNAEFRRGQLGEAILHYERARRLDPVDPDVRANLAFARTLRLDEVPEPTLPAPVRGLVTLQDRIGPRRHALAFLALVWIAAGVVAWGLSAPGRWKPHHGWLLAGAVAVALAIGASWHATWQRVEGHRLAVVLDEVVAVRAGPGESNATLATVHEGLDLEVRGEREDWVQVRLPNDLTGWVPRQAVGLVG
jgi:hypothetical protein